ncbi:hypothetical protein [Neosynechococcus sphagnicola]|nr:hypothetical protein [Neosynechococcus sphagnicola]
MLSWGLGTSVLNRGERGCTAGTAATSCRGFRQLSLVEQQKPRLQA